MVRITCSRAGDDALVRLADGPRHALACVLADWLNIYAGISPQVLRRQYFEHVIELRRALLATEEWVGSKPDTGADGRVVAAGAIHGTSITVSRRPAVRALKSKDVVSITFDGRRASTSLTSKPTRVRITLPMPTARALLQQLAEHVPMAE